MLNASRELPILMNGAMVSATLRDEYPKTQTRRPVKGMALDWLQPGMFTPEYVAAPSSLLCPYGFSGDHLWVRETLWAYGRWETRFSEKKGRDEWHFVDMTLECDQVYQYAADNPDVPVTKSRHVGVTPIWWKRPAIHMPRAVSRTTLEIAGVRVERLQRINEFDARAEGASFHEAANNLSHGGWSHDGWYVHASATESFARLWDSLNAARGYGWEVNPWVWVVEFRRLPCIDQLETLQSMEKVLPPSVT